MVQLSSPAVKSPKTSKMGKTPKKSSAIDTPAKTVVMTPKQAKNTPAKTELKTPKQAKNTPAKTEVKTPKQAKNTPAKTEAKTPKQVKNTPAKTEAKTPKQAKNTPAKSKKAKTPKQQKPAGDVEMASEGEEEAAPAQTSPKKLSVLGTSTKNPKKKTVGKEDRPKQSHLNELFVGGLAPVTQKHTLEQHFSKYGKVANVTLPWNINKSINKGFGFVSFESAESLGLALEEDHEIDGKKIGVKAAHSDAGKRKRDESEQPGGDKKRRQIIDHENELFVAGLDYSTSQDTIREHFSQFGELTHLAVPTKKGSDENKGFAFVAFKDASSSEKALAQANQQIESSDIVIKVAKKFVPKEKAPPKEVRAFPNELFVGSLPPKVTKSVLYQHFLQYGPVNKVTMPWNKTDKRNRGFGFVAFESAASLKKALGTEHQIFGQPVVVRTERSEENGAASEEPKLKKVKTAPAVEKMEEDSEEEGGEEADSEEEEGDGEEAEEEGDGEETEEEGDGEEAEEEGDGEEAEEEGDGEEADEGDSDEADEGDSDEEGNDDDVESGDDDDDEDDEE